MEKSIDDLMGEISKHDGVIRGISISGKLYATITHITLTVKVVATNEKVKHFDLVDQSIIYKGPRALGWALILQVMENFSLQVYITIYVKSIWETVFKYLA